jgi:hypothetical protein
MRTQMVPATSVIYNQLVQLIHIIFIYESTSVVKWLYVLYVPMALAKIPQCKLYSRTPAAQ